MTFCQKCGSDVEGKKFCAECGEAVDSSEEKEPELTQKTEAGKSSKPFVIGGVCLLLIILIVIIGISNCSNSNSANQPPQQNNTPLSAAETSEPKVVSIDVAYAGSTEAGAVIEKGCEGLTVTLEYDDGSTEETADYTVIGGGALVAAKTTVTTITSNGITKELRIACTTMPEPVVYSGSGDSVIDIDISEGCVLTISGNQESRHFAVKGYDASGKSTELFVNTTDPYYGTTLDATLTTKTLEITSSGEWTVEVKSFALMRIAAEGDLVEGSGDDVIRIVSSGSKAIISGNDMARHFAVHAYSNSGHDLLVNTTDPYNGTVMLKGSPYIIEVTSEGYWTIQF